MKVNVYQHKTSKIKLDYIIQRLYKSLISVETIKIGKNVQYRYLAQSFNSFAHMYCILQFIISRETATNCPDENSSTTVYNGLSAIHTHLMWTSQWPATLRPGKIRHNKQHVLESIKNKQPKTFLMHKVDIVMKAIRKKAIIELG